MVKRRKVSTDEDISSSKSIKKVRVSNDSSSSENRNVKSKWINRRRVLIFSTRGISFRDRHLMNDLLTLMPHSKKETKLDRKDKLFHVNEVAEMKNCQQCIFFEAKSKKDLFLWFTKTPNGPSVKFSVDNIHTLKELKMTGNCLRGSRPLLSFGKEFDEAPHWSLLKELFIQIFSTPNHHPKSQPFVDHILSFTITDNRIWFRNYQILEENAELTEIGPRMVLNPIRIFGGSFGGPTLYQNPNYIAPRKIRQAAKRQSGDKYSRKKELKLMKKNRPPMQIVKEDITEDVFDT